MSDAENNIKGEGGGGGEQAEGGGDHINVRVVNIDSAEIYFRIRRTTPMRKLISAYCQRMSVAPGSVRFLFDGSHVTPEQTPQDLGLEDNDMIDAVLPQTGGFSA